jgi:hypothetical protein
MSEKVVPGRGWGVVRIGARRSDVELMLGSPDDENADPDDERFVHSDYTKLGVDIRYDSRTSRVMESTYVGGSTDMVGVGLFGHPDYVPFRGTTDKGIALGATPEQVRAAYGQPQLDRASDADGHDGRYVGYPGVVFYFESGRLTLITVTSDR